MDKGAQCAAVHGVAEGVGDGQGDPVHCSPCRGRELGKTTQLN